uniref:Uncharacterized protein n=1 Tax=Strigamia maritima TaxID=126957 RepID=T1JLS7_STRMM
MLFVAKSQVPFTFPRVFIKDERMSGAVVERLIGAILEVDCAHDSRMNLNSQKGERKGPKKGASEDKLSWDRGKCYVAIKIARL